MTANHSGHRPASYPSPPAALPHASTSSNASGLTKNRVYLNGALEARAYLKLMKMHRPGLKAMRVVARAVVAALSLTAATSSSAVDTYGKDFYPFPTALSLPRRVPANTVVARAYLTPQQLCGEASCRLVYFLPNNIFPDGTGLGSAGPTVATEIRSLDMRVLVNGLPQKRLGEENTPPQFTSQIEIQLLRNNSTELVNAASSDRVAFWFFTKTLAGNDRIKNYIHFNSTLTGIEGTCTVPSQAVELPSTRAGSLKGVGTTAGERSFRININDCPKGYNKIFYRLKPAGDTIETSAGVLPLSPESTAKGVKIRVTDSAGAAVVFDTSTRIDDYNKDTGGSFSIPMRVSYIQTAANVTPGTVNGAMSVLMEYQ
ncbi:fimbrial protein [Streptococcus agalactiae]|nr:fimbrial protein [Ralstonia sp. LMG 32965]